MRTRMYFNILVAISIFAVATITSAENVNWSATDTAGSKITVPAADRPSVLAFVRPEQTQSQQALEQIKSLALEKTQIVVIISGETADDQAKTLASAGKYSWPIVSDPDFKVTGQLGVHVWPTTLVISPSGEQAAHLAGLNNSFANDLRDYVDLAAGKIDQATLQKRLTSHAVVVEAPAQMAGSYLQVAKRLIEIGDYDQAHSQLDQAIKLQPDDPALKFAMAQVLSLQSHPGDALQMLEAIPAGAVPPGPLAVVRGRALIGLEKWDLARTTLQDGIGLNPDPAETHYLLGLIFQHDKDWPHAAESFRKAYESREKRRTNQ